MKLHSVKEVREALIIQLLRDRSAYHCARKELWLATEKPTPALAAMMAHTMSRVLEELADIFEKAAKENQNGQKKRTQASD